MTKTEEHMVCSPHVSVNLDVSCTVLYLHCNYIVNSYTTRAPVIVIWLYLNTCLSIVYVCFIGSLDVHKFLSTSSKSAISKFNVISSGDVEAVFKCYIHDFVLFFCDSSEQTDNTKVKCIAMYV